MSSPETNTTEKSTPTTYRLPPIVERVSSVFATMDQEVFEARRDSWGALVMSEFPRDESIQQWIVKAEEREGIPLFDTIQPELKITPRFSKKSESEDFDWSIRCPCGQFTMNMHSMPGDGRRYSDLLSEFAKWFPKWLEHFDVKDVQRIGLHYVNMLNPRTVPKFVTPEGELLIEDILNVFSSIPGEHEGIVAPYDCRVTLQVKDTHTGKVSIRVRAVPSAKIQPAVRVDLLVAAGPKITSSSLTENVLAVLEWSHQQILDRFDLVFTKEAKESFDPMNE